MRPLRYRVPCPFGLMFSQTMMYDDIYLVREALFRMVNGYARPDDPMLVSRFFGRRLSPFEFAECLQWLDGYLNEWGY